MLEKIAAQGTKREYAYATDEDTLGIGGIMRGIRTVPHLWSICEDLAVSPRMKPG